MSSAAGHAELNRKLVPIECENRIDNPNSNRKAAKSQLNVEKFLTPLNSFLVASLKENNARIKKLKFDQNTVSVKMKTKKPMAVDE